LVGGTRDCDDAALVKRHLDRLTKKYKVVLVVTGANIDKSGRTWQADPDRLAKEWAFKCGDWPAVRLFYAEWFRRGSAAGPLRNEDMVRGLVEAKADRKGAVFFWDGKSPGTRDTIRRCEKKGIVTKVIRYRG
jgi:hypothetical protein